MAKSRRKWGIDSGPIRGLGTIGIDKRITKRDIERQKESDKKKRERDPKHYEREKRAGKVIHDRRSPNAKAMDEAITAQKVYVPGARGSEKWLKAMNRSDLAGVDTPTSPLKPKPKTKCQTKAPPALLAAQTARAQEKAPKLKAGLKAGRTGKPRGAASTSKRPKGAMFKSMVGR